MAITGRPRKPIDQKKVDVCVRLEPEIIKKIGELAVRLNTTKSIIMRTAIENFLKQYE